MLPLNRNHVTAIGLLLLFRCSLLAQSVANIPIPELPRTFAAIAAPPAFTPMTQKERFQNYFNTTFSATAILSSAASAGLSQLNDHPTEWGQGAQGYARRFDNAYAKTIINQTMVLGISSALHEDNRYIRSGQGGFGPRLKYAVASSFLARRDDGTRRVSISRIGGTVGTAFISRIWQPPSTGSVGDATFGISISMGTQVAFNVAREFVHRKEQ